MAPQISPIDLSNLCNNLIDGYDNFLESGQDYEFWMSILEFDKELRSLSQEMKKRLGIDHIIGELHKTFDTLGELRTERNDAEKDALDEAKRKSSRDVRKNYRIWINNVQELKEKAEQFESPKISKDIKIGWAPQFLNKYYMVINNAGALNELVDLMMYQFFNNVDERSIIGNFMKQKQKLNLMSNHFEYLSMMDNGLHPDLKSNMSTISLLVKELQVLYIKKIEMDIKVEEITKSHEKLKDEILNLYKETIKRSIIQ